MYRRSSDRFGIATGDFDKCRSPEQSNIDPLNASVCGRHTPRNAASSRPASIKAEPTAVGGYSALHGASEILLVDPAASNLGTILKHLRPEVWAIVLDDQRPAGRRMASALAGHPELRAVHVIAHGAPGRIGFAADDWSSETLADGARDLATIGRSLGESGSLGLWNSRAGAGAAGLISSFRCRGRPEGRSRQHRTTSVHEHSADFEN